MTYMPPASPANIDASLTSLSTGSLTTVARADHVHTVSNVVALIASSTVTTATTSITLSNIPQGYRFLEARVSARCDDTNLYPYIRIRLNGDTGSNYITYQAVTDTSIISDFLFGNGNFSSSATGVWDEKTITFSHYSSTSKQKTIMSYVGSWNNSSSTWAPYGPVYQPSYWLNTSAITSITFFISSGVNFRVGTTIGLYGRP